MYLRSKVILVLVLVLLLGIGFFIWFKFNQPTIKYKNTSKTADVSADVGSESNVTDTNINYDPTCQETNCSLLGADRNQRPIKVEIGDDPVLGQAEAGITMIEFSDFGCPFCRKFFDESFSYLKKKYIDTGKVKFVYKDLPVTASHPNAGLAAQAAGCAGDQGRFWPYHDWLFQAQDSWNSSPAAGGIFITAAKTLGLNSLEFEHCLTSAKYESEVKQDLSDGFKYGVEATPTFFVNGIKYTGVLSPKELDEILR